MQIKFNKYHGTGNDFIIIDERKDSSVKWYPEVVEQLCDRRFGIGADGLILLKTDDDTDFSMVYFNADGKEGSMCGNGGRCIAAFAHTLGIGSDQVTFNAIDGLHRAQIHRPDYISLEMQAVSEVELVGVDYVLNTGSPHYVQFRHNLNKFNAVDIGRTIRNSDAYKVEGINVNFVELRSTGLFVRTYERGVEDETWSCGTGVVASAIARAYRDKMTGQREFRIFTRGGNLQVSFDYKDNQFSDIWLTGPAVHVYDGEMQI